MPGARRPGAAPAAAAAAGGLFAVAQGYGVLVLGWHYPSDVVAACAIAAGWLALGVTAADLVPQRPRRERLAPAARAVAARRRGGARRRAVATAVLARPDRTVYYVQQHTAFVAAAVALATAALGLVAVTAAALTLIERGASS